MTTRISRDAYGLRLAEAAASRADCTRRQVGAVIVAEDGSVVATGYNGLASGLPGCASAGACPRGRMAYPSEPPVKVGDDVEPGGPYCEERGPDSYLCTAHREGWHIATGFGTVIEVWPAAPTHPADTGYEATGCRAVHAEVNAIIRAGRDRCVGATIYVTDEPCFHCSVVIEGAGLARVVRPSEGGDDYYVRTVTATVPPPSAATSATTYATGGYVGPVPANAGAPGVRHGLGMDPVLHAALVRSVERGRREANDGPGPDGHHVVTGECFACMVGVATGPESHGDRCPRSADRLREAMDGPQ